jgi:murein DD-endopeptidase MepM/ murein hydrolase activator NlpD
MCRGRRTGDEELLMARRAGRGRPERGHEESDEFDGADARDDRFDSDDEASGRSYDRESGFTSERAPGRLWDTGYDDAYDEGEGSLPARRGGALVPADERDLWRPPASGNRLPVPIEEEDAAPVIIPGSGQFMGMGLLARRERPLAMRLAVTALIACVLCAGLFSVAPLSSGGADAAGSPFDALSGAVVWHPSVGFFWYTVRAGDNLEALANRFNCAIGGFLELNGMLAGQELQIGKAYKIPTDPTYGLNYQPPSYVVGGYGATVYGPGLWSSLAGIPPEGAICGPNGQGNPAGYDLKSPNWNSYWARGFTWFHNGVDLDNPLGTPVHAAQAGEVIFAGWDGGGGGWSVKINHCNHVATFYCHMERLLVKVHDMMHVGDVIGLEGSTGWSTGPHTHFSVEWNNNPVNPLSYFNWSIYNITHFIPDH